MGTCFIQMGTGFIQCGLALSAYPSADVLKTLTISKKIPFLTIALQNCPICRTIFCTPISHFWVTQCILGPREGVAWPRSGLQVLGRLPCEWCNLCVTKVGKGIFLLVFTFSKRTPSSMNIGILGGYRGTTVSTSAVLWCKFGSIQWYASHVNIF